MQQESSKEVNLYAGYIRVLGTFLLHSSPKGIQWLALLAKVFVGMGRGREGEAQCSILSKPVISKDFEKLKNSQHDEGNLI